MESGSPTRERFRSFSIKRKMAALRRNRSSDSFDVKYIDQKENDHHHINHLDISSSLLSIYEQVDRFLETTSCDGHADNYIEDVQFPNSVEELCKMVESMVDRYSNHMDIAFRGPSSKFGHNQQEDKNFYQALHRISKLSSIFCNTPLHNHNVSNTALMNRTTSVVHKAMCFLDSELRQFLQNPNKSNVVSSDHHTKSSNKKGAKILASFHSIEESTDRSIVPDQDSSAAASAQEDQDDQRFPPFSQETISNVNKIATAMVKCGYELECRMIFTTLRKTDFKAELQKMGYESISIDDIHRMQWVSLEADIAAWTNIVRHCSTVLFSGERELCDSVFSSQPDISKSIFSEVGKAVILLLLKFAEAIALTTGSGEKLFKMLDMYETLRDLELAIIDMFPEECAEELKREVMDVKRQLGEVSVCMFCDLENSIERDHGKVPVPSGAVHPLIRYVMNYLKYSCEYNDTLEEVFLQHLTGAGKWKSLPYESPETAESERKADETPKKSAFGEQLIKVMDLLDENLENKSSLYRNPALRYIFLMNNGRYMLQKVKGSKEIHEAVGDNWCRRRSTVVRQYHKKYQRETWGKVLECLRHEGLQERGKVLKPVLKERLKSFTAMMDEINKTQSTWVVSDEQLKSELRVSISAVVIPAYRSFLGRFKQYLDPGKQTHKYIKYQHEDVENLIEKLFDGNSNSMAKRRT